VHRVVPTHTADRHCNAKRWQTDATFRDSASAGGSAAYQRAFLKSRNGGESIRYCMSYRPGHGAEDTNARCSGGPAWCRASSTPKRAGRASADGGAADGWYQWRVGRLPGSRCSSQLRVRVRIPSAFAEHVASPETSSKSGSVSYLVHHRPTVLEMTVGLAVTPIHLARAETELFCRQDCLV
jgi:hypothetical protein